MRIPLLRFDAVHDGQPRQTIDAPPVAELACGLLKLRRAQERWASTPIRERLAVIRRVRHEIARSARDLASAAGHGLAVRPVAESLTSQVLPLAEACRYLEREACHVLAPRRLGARNRPFWLRSVEAEVRREALGLVLIIAPSNYPLFIPGVAALQALAAGNAVLLKPGSKGAEAALALRHVLELAGLDPALLCVLPESSEAAEHAIAAGVDKVVFTGSAATGEKVLSQLARTLTPATMELSGCDAVFVRADADLDLVVRGLVFGLRLNGGATCIAPRRVFVHRSICTELEGRLTEALAGEAALPIRARDTDQMLMPVLEALAEGAHILSGRILPGGRVVGPLVLAGVRPGARWLQADVFAQVLSLVTVDSDDDALELASLSPYALGATIFSANLAAARALAGRVAAGVVVINDMVVPTADPRLPFGGRKRSGFGVTRGAEGLLDMTVPKVITFTSGAWRPHFGPPAARDADLFIAYLRMVHGCGGWRRFRALITLIRALLRPRTATEPAPNRTPLEIL